jgi:L-seryl-tRNA(Ser) seleniumtransferase
VSRPSQPPSPDTPPVDPRRAVPSVEGAAQTAARRTGAGHGLCVSVAREVVARARARVEAGEPVDRAAVEAEVADAVEAVLAGLLRPVLNATGVLLHTNLGRAPLDAAALQAAVHVGGAYSTLEYRLADGGRGSRHEHAGGLLARACGAEAGLVVNNGAAAVLLVLAALARGSEVVVSRGELVEIGGGFRVPEVMAESGARLVEVGTTNRTRRADYERAVGPATALVLKVHASNYRIVGFAESTPVAALVDLGVPVVVDAGSGLLDAATPWLSDGPPAWLADEPGVRQCLEAGAALVTCSGDKLLGGPQAGIVVGRADLVAQVARHPLARAVRADKLTLAACQATALAYLDGTAGDLPLWRMAAAPVDGLRARADALVATLGVAVPGTTVVELAATPGGGSAPGADIPSIGVALPPGPGVDATTAALRRHGVVARVDADRVVCDLRTVEPTADLQLAAAVVAAWTAVAAG